jgi:hypothetical protein
MSIVNKTLAKEIIIEKAKEDELMKQTVQNKTIEKQKKLME